MENMLFLSVIQVEVKDPLKQGLKHHIIDFQYVPNCIVEVKDPLKQGLKPQ